MPKVLITVGPIPARLDSVKYITNRFQGGLALKTSEKLSNLKHQVTLVAWEYLKIETNLPIIRVKDVYDYFQKVTSFKADAYILAAAVANLAPFSPFVGKFPSHKYKVGDKFSIDFTIAPRTIDEIKKRYPVTTLIGYKLFDGTRDELIRAGQKTLFESRANIIFANHPDWAKEKKIAITADGACFDITFDEHIKLIDSLLKSRFYKTKMAAFPSPTLDEETEFVIQNYPRDRKADQVFGTFAARTGAGFITTTRGKRAGEKSLSFVKKVDHRKRIVYTNRKATLNAPLLDMLFQRNPHIKFLIHGHELIGKKIQKEYQFPGTDGDLKNSFQTKKKSFIIRLPYHGYIAGFADFSDCKQFVNKHRNVD